MEGRGIGQQGINGCIILTEGGSCKYLSPCTIKIYHGQMVPNCKDFYRFQLLPHLKTINSLKLNFMYVHACCNPVRTIELLDETVC